MKIWKIFNFCFVCFWIRISKSIPQNFSKQANIKSFLPKNFLRYLSWFAFKSIEIAHIFLSQLYNLIYASCLSVMGDFPLFDTLPYSMKIANSPWKSNKRASYYTQNSSTNPTGHEFTLYFHCRVAFTKRNDSWRHPNLVAGMDFQFFHSFSFVGLCWRWNTWLLHCPPS